MKQLISSMAKRLPGVNRVIARRDELQESVGTLNRQINDLQSQLALRAADVDELQRQLTGLRSHNEELTAKLAGLCSHNEELTAKLAELHSFGDILRAADYNHDSLIVWCKNPTFLKDERFRRAYMRGMHSGHKFGKEIGIVGPDIHIEWRIHICCMAAMHAKQLPGDFVECGVNTGMFSLALCDYIDFNSTGKAFYLFDTYNGLPEEQMLDGELPKVEYGRRHYEDCYELARRNFQPFPRAKLVRGRVPESLTTVDIEKVCYLSLDMNLAYPEVAALDFFWDKLVTGAVVVLDDYLWMFHRMQKEKLDEFAKTKGVEIFHLPTGQGLLLKP